MKKLLANQLGFWELAVESFREYKGYKFYQEPIDNHPHCYLEIGEYIIWICRLGEFHEIQDKIDNGTLIQWINDVFDKSVSRGFWNYGLAKVLNKEHIKEQCDAAKLAIEKKKEDEKELQRLQIIQNKIDAENRITEKGKLLLSGTDFVYKADIIALLKRHNMWTKIPIKTRGWFLDSFVSFNPDMTYSYRGNKSINAFRIVKELKDVLTKDVLYASNCTELQS